MAIFGKGKSKEEKAEIETNKILEKYGLNEIAPEDLETIKRITNDLAGNGLMKAGMALSFAKVEEQAKVGYLSALVEQNWIIIRQLDRLNKKLEK